MKTKDKDLLVNPLADIKPPREGPTFIERKTDSLNKIWSLFKDAVTGWSFGSSSLSGIENLRPPRPRPQAPPRLKRSTSLICPLCGTNDCLNRKEMQNLRNKSGSLGNTLLRSCEVRRQLKEMEKFRVRTSGGDDVWMTKQGRIQRPTKPPPPPNPPPVAVKDEITTLKAENAALKSIMDDKLAEMIKIEKAKDAEMKRYHDEKRHKDTADASEILRRIRGRTRPPVR